MEDKNQLTLFKVRDLRIKEHYQVDDAYLNGWAKICKPIATAVYNSLCRHAGSETQKAFPSQGLIASQHGISIATVKRALKRLEKCNIILIEQEKIEGKFKNNIYTLLDKSEWKKIDTVALERPTALRSSFCIDGKRPIKDNERLRITSSSNEEEQTTSVVADKVPINELISLFKPINPSYCRLFANKGQRSSVERLFKLWGKEKLEQILKMLPKTNICQFAPIITTPVELESKIGKLMAFIQKEDNKQSMVIKI